MKCTVPLPIPISTILLPTGTGSGSVQSPEKSISPEKQMANSSAKVLESVFLGSSPSSVISCVILGDNLTILCLKFFTCDLG